MASDGYVGLLSGFAMWGYEVHFSVKGLCPVSGGEAGGSFSDLGATYSLQPASSVGRPSSLQFSIFIDCIFNIGRRIRTARKRLPNEVLLARLQLFDTSPCRLSTPKNNE